VHPETEAAFSMQSTKGEGESFRDYFQRARHDAGVRRQIMRSAGMARSLAGWLAAVFVSLAVWRTLAQGLRGGGWISTEAIAYSIVFVLCMKVYAKFGDRIAALRAMDEPGDSAS
jgi:hypothetical protein